MAMEAENVPPMAMEAENVPPAVMQLPGKQAASSSGPLLQRRRTKSVAVDSGKTPVIRRPLAVRKVEMAEVEAGKMEMDEVEAGKMEIAGVEAGKMAAGSGIKTKEAKPAGTRKTKLVKVQQRYIDCLLKRTPLGPFPTLSDELIDISHETPEDRERYRKLQAETAALFNKSQEEDAAILQQYRTYGFAMQEIEIRDEDD